MLLQIKQGRRKTLSRQKTRGGGTRGGGTQGGGTQGGGTQGGGDNYKLLQLKWIIISTYNEDWEREGGIRRRGGGGGDGMLLS